MKRTNFVALFIVLIIILLLSYQGIIKSLDKVNIDTKKEIASPITLNFKDTKLNIDPWETFLQLDDKTDRVLGTHQYKININNTLTVQTVEDKVIIDKSKETKIGYFYREEDNKTITKTNNY